LADQHHHRLINHRLINIIIGHPNPNQPSSGFGHPTLTQSISHP
jgi:hypothetical protein